MVRRRSSMLGVALLTLAGAGCAGRSQGAAGPCW